MTIRLPPRTTLFSSKSLTEPLAMRRRSPLWALITWSMERSAGEEMKMSPDVPNGLPVVSAVT